MVPSLRTLKHSQEDNTVGTAVSSPCTCSDSAKAIWLDKQRRFFRNIQRQDGDHDDDSDDDSDDDVKCQETHPSSTHHTVSELRKSEKSSESIRPLWACSKR